MAHSRADSVSAKYRVFPSGERPQPLGVMDGKGDGLDAAAVGLGIVDGATVDLARTALAEVGEIETAMRIEHDVVRALERITGARGVKRLDCACRQVDALDAAARIVVRLACGDQPHLR